MQIKMSGLRSVENLLRLRHFRCRPVNQQNFIAFHCRFILENTVFGMPMLYRPAPSALNPPTRPRLQGRPTIHATSGPATNRGPMPGIAKKAAPNKMAQKPPQAPPKKAPDLPHRFIRSPAL